MKQSHSVSFPPGKVNTWPPACPWDPLCVTESEAARGPSQVSEVVTQWKRRFFWDSLQHLPRYLAVLDRATLPAARGARDWSGRVPHSGQPVRGMALGEPSREGADHPHAQEPDTGYQLPGAAGSQGRQRWREGGRITQQMSKGRHWGQLSDHGGEALPAPARHPCFTVSRGLLEAPRLPSPCAQLRTRAIIVCCRHR